MDYGHSTPGMARSPSLSSTASLTTESLAPWLSVDPRETSVQSLSPTVGPTKGQRRLLIMYIHGFQGTNTSFKQFPYHVHQYLKLFLDSHVIYTKVYPRYKTYKSLEAARDNFSAWLNPHESEDSDVILVGHSMGGLLAAEVALMPNRSPYRRHPFKHRILGTVSLDAPLLGLHPGIIGAGLASLFRKPPPNPAEDSSSGLSSPEGITPPSLSCPSEEVVSEMSQGPPDRVETMDPTYNPAYFNDVNFAERPLVERLRNFWVKHSSEGVVPAFTNHFRSHLEFGSCLVDFAGLNMRYDRLRALEDYEDVPPTGSNSSNQTSAPAKARIRFVNYYTVSNGIRRQQSQTCQSPSRTPDSQSMLSPRLGQLPSTTRISISDHSASSNIEALPLTLEGEEEEFPDPPESAIHDESFEPSAATGASQSSASDPVQVPGPAFMAASDDGHESEHTITHVAAIVPELPAIPDIPHRPQQRDLEAFADKHERRQVEKEDKKSLKAYVQAVRDRDKIIKKRDKMMEKHQKQLEKDAAKKEKSQKKKRQREKPDDSDLMEALHREAAELQEERDEPSIKAATADPKTPEASMGSEEPPKERKFCTLPRKNHGVRDRTWVPVNMGYMDQVTAHSAIFLQGPHYEPLVVQMGATIVDWIHEDLSRRAIQQMALEEAEFDEGQF